MLWFYSILAFLFYSNYWSSFCFFAAGLESESSPSPSWWETSPSEWSCLRSSRLSLLSFSFNSFSFCFCDLKRSRLITGSSFGFSCTTGKGYVLTPDWETVYDVTERAPVFRRLRGTFALPACFKFFLSKPSCLLIWSIMNCSCFFYCSSRVSSGSLPGEADPMEPSRLLLSRESPPMSLSFWSFLCLSTSISDTFF